MLNYSSKLRCKKFGCDTELNPIGNVSYGTSRLAEGLKRWGLTAVGCFMLFNFVGGMIVGFLDLDISKFWVPPIHLTFILSAVIIYGVAYLLPKTTTVTCHKCGHVTESIGRASFVRTIPDFTDAPSSEAEVNEVIDHTLIDLEEVEKYHEEKKEKNKAKSGGPTKRGRRYIKTNGTVNVPGHRKMC